LEPFVNDALWIELIKIVPALLWTGIGLAALVIARRLLAQQAHRMTRVESPFVSVDFAQDAIVESFNRGPESNRSETDSQDDPRLNADGRSSEEAGPRDAGDAFRFDDGQFLDGDGPRHTYADMDLDKTHELRARPQGTSATRPPSYFTVASDPQLGLRAATRLANATAMLRGGAILWVDDHHQWNEPLVRLFRAAGIVVDLVGTTDEAMRALDRRAYDLVITDLRRELDPGDEYAGIALLDRMIARGVPTPGVLFSDNPKVLAISHPRAAATTNNPEVLVDHVVDLVGARRASLHQQANADRGGLSFEIR
jgi:hypothetical protein